MGVHLLPPRLEFVPPTKVGVIIRPAADIPGQIDISNVVPSGMSHAQAIGEPFPWDQTYIFETRMQQHYDFFTWTDPTELLSRIRVIYFHLRLFYSPGISSLGHFGATYLVNGTRGGIGRIEARQEGRWADYRDVINLDPRTGDRWHWQDFKNVPKGLVAVGQGYPDYYIYCSNYYIEMIPE